MKGPAIRWGWPVHIVKHAVRRDWWNLDSESQWSPPESSSSKREPQEHLSRRCSIAPPSDPRPRPRTKGQPDKSAEPRLPGLLERDNRDNSSGPAAGPLGGGLSVTQPV